MRGYEETAPIPLLLVVLAFGGLAIPRQAGAYETICAPIEVSDLESSIRSVVCAGPDAPACASGPGAARGHLVGEHVALAFEALERAGLGTFNSDPLALRYWSDGQAVPTPEGGSAVGASVMPTGPAAMTEAVEREHWLAEFAEVTDLSYSLSDWLLGNEHCLAPNALIDEALGTPEGVAACHTFASHMGAVNSTHFPPQTRAMYELYHSHALLRAVECDALQDAFSVAPEHPASETMQQAVRACEEQALVLEAVASHYLGDTWSSGHMWERWGSPVFSPVAFNRFRAQVVALIAGLVHGWRSVARTNIGDFFLQHDRLCMPGRFDPGDAGEAVVEWRYVPEELDDGLREGGGDLYLFACNAIDMDPQRAVETAPALALQYERMVTCLALGFAEVYQAGPQSLGELVPGALDPAISSPLDPLCWEQRVTNRSMALGFGVNGWDATQDPEGLARVLPVVLPLGAEYSSQTGVEEVEVVAAGLLTRYELVRMAERFHRSAEVNPDGTSQAVRPNPTVAADDTVTGRLLGLDRNSAYVPLITDDQVPYLELHDRENWSARPLAQACTADSDCAPGQLCDRGSVSDAGNSANRYCAFHESAVLRAFRTAELATWCTETRDVDLEAANEVCVSLGGAACDACEALAEPLARRACDEASYLQLVELREAGGGYDRSHDALCDLVDEAGLTRSGQMSLRYLPLPGPPATAALAACQRPDGLRSRELVEGAVIYDMDESPPGSAEAIEPGLEQDRFTCGATVGTYWRRLAATADEAGYAVELRLTTRPIPLVEGPDHQQDALGLSLDLFDDCATSGLPTARSVPFNEDGLPGSEGRSVIWRVPEGGGEVCARVKAEGDGVWAAYDFEITVSDETDPCADLVHSLAIAPTDGADILVGTEGDDIILGMGGNDQILGLGGDDTLCGGRGDDVIEGGDGADLLDGWLGADELDGGPGNDILLAGPGTDTLRGGGGDDSLRGDGMRGVAEADQDPAQAGDDVLYGGDGADGIKGNRGNDSIYGGPGNDILVGDAGHDTIHGYLDPADPDFSPDFDGPDIDNITGGLGNDLLLDGGPDNDSIFGDFGGSCFCLDAEPPPPDAETCEGDDHLVGGPGDDGLLGGPGNDTLEGGDGSDNLYGNGGDDVLQGGTGDDLLQGHQTFFGCGTDGDDELDGGPDDDELVGGPGADTVSGGDGDDDIVADGDDTIDAGDGSDCINVGAFFPPSCDAGPGCDGCANTLDLQCTNCEDTLPVDAGGCPFDESGRNTAESCY